MEANGGVGGGEVRRLHVIYFLSRTGRIEQPHLIRVSHLNKNGVYLRDVKRWLSELRGKDMPDSFSWSYKRRYKKGYVWQDLLEDDLITPISDNEFVLKGTEIVPASLGNETKQSSINILNFNLKTETPTPMEAPGRSLVTDESMKDEKILNDHDDNNSDISSSSSLYSALFKKSDKEEDEDGRVGKNIETPASTPSPTSSPFARSKSYSGLGVRTSLFRNLLTCGAVDADDSVLVMRNKDQPKPSGGQICKGEKLGGSARVFGTCWNQQNPRRSYDGPKSQTNGQKKPVCAAYRPVHGPTCSQCGKSFRPEKLHKHMKSCKGLKNMATKAAQKVPTSKSTSDEPVFSHFLTN